MYRRTYAEIDLNAIAGNLGAFRELIGRNIKILMPVKANAYGHGIVEVSRHVEETGSADMLGISSPDEGELLRKEGITLPLLNMGLILPDEDQVRAVLDNNIIQTIADFRMAEVLSSAAAARGIKASVHVKIDTGMGRIGCSSGEAVKIIRRIAGLNHVDLEGVYSHYPVADEPGREFNMEQINRFHEIIEKLEHLKIDIPVRHISNSAGTVNFTENIYEMIRPGIMSYGYLPMYGMQSSVAVTPSMTLKSLIVFTKRIKKGTALSYGLTYTSETDTNIATVPIGYGDGYSRFLSNRGRVIIRDRIYPVVGRVTMDQIMIKLGDDNYEPGEEVILFGKEKITVDDIANMYGTIPYEVTCQISSRVPRVYTR